MKFYETVFIVRQDATSSQVEGLAQQYTKTIEDLGGKVSKTELCGLRSLAYPIKKNKKGHYVLLNLALDGKHIQEIERQMRLNESLLRFLIIAVDELDNQPSVLMQQKSFENRRFDDDYDLLAPMPNNEEKKAEEA